MKKCFVILAAGKGLRFNSKFPKQYILFKGKSILQHSIDKALKSKLFDKIIIVINKSHTKYLNNINKNKITLINGGKERQDSSYKALKYLDKFNPSKIFIHDAARPNFSIKLLMKLNRELKLNKAVVPTVNLDSSIKIKNKKKYKNLDRNKVTITQTPQCFDYKTLKNLYKNNNKMITDDVSLFLERNLNVKFIKGEKDNIKITNKNDLFIKNIKSKYGIGFDVHRLVPGRKLYLGGLKIKSKLGTLGHSDGDPVLHAITDAILGACKMGDIGQKFSNKNKKYKNIRSTKLLKKVINEIKLKKYFINNLDINIITQTPKITKFKNKMIKSISDICKITKNQINIKGKTTEKLGIIGKEKAIACEAIASVTKYD